MFKNALISGNFNVLHPGHVRLFKFAKENCKRLTVAVLSDSLSGKSAYIPENLRLEGVSTNNFVDESFILREPISDYISRAKPDIVIKGREHESKKNIEEIALKEYGGKLIFGSGDFTFAMPGNLHHINKDILKIPSDYLKRHNIKTKNLKYFVEKFSSLKVLVIGDLIIDEYISCKLLGLSQEEPTLVVSPSESKSFVGGAGIVAAHASSLGANVSLISVVGIDKTKDFALKNLNKFGVENHFFVDPSRPTTLKKRYRVENRSMLKVSEVHQDAVSVDIQDDIYNYVLEVIDKFDMLVFSDFNYGCLPTNLVRKISKIAKQKKKFVSADSQSSSQVGDVSKFQDIDLITPTEREARISLKNHEDGLVVLSQSLKEKTKVKYVLLKLGREGVMIQEKISDKLMSTDQIPALNINPIDVSGAGDSMLISSSMALALGANIWEAGLIGSVSAALQISQIGNNPLNLSEILHVLGEKP